ncbi:hypothetical protein ACKC9G_00605 [Pokkaliibacter sp. CJK22405]|uniref:hypothetical protein n=1 Tax=Pokkaliibacter sp. CJK22405 TaxID=3384615 RepID=UPI003985646D
MPHPISAIGYVHTLVSLVPFFAGLYGFARYGAILTTRLSGKLYVGGICLSALTALLISSSGGFNIAHVVSLVIMVIALASLVTPKLGWLGRGRPYLTTFALSFSYLLSLVPATNETLSRLPPSAPLAQGPQSPIVVHFLMLWAVLFVIGFAVQCWKIYRKGANVH